MRLLTRRVMAAEPAVDAPTAEEEAWRAAVEWTGPAAWVTKAISGLLLACLAAGPVGLLLAGWLLWASGANTPPPAPVVSSDPETMDERTAAEAFAADFVATWLTTVTGQEKRLARFLPAYSGLTLPEAPWLVWDAIPAGIVSVDGSWSVTVAATVAESTQEPAVRRYFQVPVVHTDGALVAQALPAPVSAPQQATAPKLAYRYRAGLDDPVAAAAGEFLTALLVGGDVTRFVSPSARIRAVTPAPYTAVEVDDVQVDADLTEVPTASPTDGLQLHLLVTATVTPTTRAGALTVQYALTVTARTGRWEVSSLDPAPAASPNQPTADPLAPVAGQPSASPGTSSQAPGPGPSTVPATHPPVESPT
jgi:hypothetical protein